MALHLLKFPYRKVLAPIAKKLRWVHPDILSYIAVLVAAGTGWCLYKGDDSPNLLLVAVVLTVTRMTLNTLDGVLAIQRNRTTRLGKIVNALPDRYSDLFVVGGIALSPLCRDWLGVAGLCSMFLVSYTGMLGKALGVTWQQHGPLDKVERLTIIMIFSIIQFVILPENESVKWLGFTATPFEWAMGLFIIFGQITVLRRLYAQVREIIRDEATEESSGK